MATEKAVDQLVGALHKAANASPGPLATQVRGIANSLVKSLKTERQGGDLTRQAPFTVVVTNFPKDLPQQDMMNIMGLFGEVTACLMLGRKAEVTFRKKAAAERVVNGFKRVCEDWSLIMLDVISNCSNTGSWRVPDDHLEGGGTEAEGR